VQIVLCACAPFQFQARIKQLAFNRGRTGEDYILVLPASPAELLANYPRVAANLFDKDNLPVSSPLRADAVAFVRSKMNLRPNRGNSQQLAESAGCRQMTPNMMLQGLRKHACMHA
jgi:hypothetical protein